MKRTLFILLFCIWSSSLAYTQRNYAQELVDLLQQGRCFEAIALYTNHADQLPQNDRALMLLYQYHLAQFFNKPDSAGIYLEELLGNNDYQMTLGPVTSWYYAALLRQYGAHQEFKLGIVLCDKILEYYERNPFNFDQALVQSEKDYIEELQSEFKDRDLNEPLIKIDRINKRKNESIQLYEDEYIRFDAKYNGVLIETLFDTGLDFYFVTEQNLADEIGIKDIKKNQNTQKLVNGLPTEAYDGIIDSIDVGHIRLYNIPVLVLKEKLAPQLPDTLNDVTRKNVERVFTDRQIVMGVPTMRLMGKFEFDWNQNTLSFPEGGERKSENNTSNVFLIDNELYVHLKINGLNYSGRLDSGSNDLLTIKPSFYEKHISLFEIDSGIEQPYNHYTTSSIYLNSPYKIVKKAGIFFRGYNVENNTGEVLIIENTFNNKLDGFIGVHFLKRLLPKVILDFDNMEIQNY